MFGIKLDVKPLRKVLIALAGNISQSAQFTLWQTAQNIRDEMREEGSPIVYPVQWDSTKQRKAFFATDGFGRGIPTRRSGQAVGAWQAIQMQDGAQVMNPLSHIVFISGRRQSKIHKGRWKLFHIVVDAAIKLLPEKLRTQVTVTIREQGFEIR